MSNKAMNDTGRIAILEENIAHLERFMDQLNQAVIEQSKTIARLEKKVEKLSEKLEEEDSQMPVEPPSPPPHYDIRRGSN